MKQISIGLVLLGAFLLTTSFSVQAAKGSGKSSSSRSSKGSSRSKSSSGTRKSPGRHNVKGYYRKDGTYVHPYVAGSGPLASRDSGGYGTSPGYPDSPSSLQGTVPATTSTPFLSQFAAGKVSTNGSLKPLTLSRSAKTSAIDGQEQPFLITPGVGIEVLNLGDSRQQARQVFGEPLFTLMRSPGVDEDLWQFTEPLGFNRSEQFRAVYDGDKIIQIKVISPRFALTSGVSMAAVFPRDTLSQALKDFPTPKIFAFSDADDKSLVWHFYDEFDAGIAFQMINTDYVFGDGRVFDDGFISSIIVHEPRRVVSPNIGSGIIPFSLPTYSK